ncbi:hypothetical protein CYMTET_46668 [Cymbomonas tetramitiformis]|uniref:J domain-containing protein n=1 Tax=Cymbomonas tetramitiformis TaxID=36881 RepID=A0AAE0BVP8_9CHLO|nr:hypothetical protein CYMTET_46668 [Cymbomonas tetramitiformis]
MSTDGDQRKASAFAALKMIRQVELEAYTKFLMVFMLKQSEKLESMLGMLETELRISSEVRGSTLLTLNSSDEMRELRVAKDLLLQETAVGNSKTSQNTGSISQDGRQEQQMAAKGGWMASGWPPCDQAATKPPCARPASAQPTSKSTTGPAAAGTTKPPPARPCTVHTNSERSAKAQPLRPASAQPLPAGAAKPQPAWPTGTHTHSEGVIPQRRRPGSAHSSGVRVAKPSLARSSTSPLSRMGAANLSPEVPPGAHPKPGANDVPKPPPVRLANAMPASPMPHATGSPNTPRGGHPSSAHPSARPPVPETSTARPQADAGDGASSSNGPSPRHTHLNGKQPSPTHLDGQQSSPTHFSGRQSSPNAGKQGSPPASAPTTCPDPAASTSSAQPTPPTQQTHKPKDHTIVSRDHARALLQSKLSGISQGNLPRIFGALGITVSGGESPSPAEVKAAYRQFALRYHPDRALSQGSGAQFYAEEVWREIQSVYDLYWKLQTNKAAQALRQKPQNGIDPFSSPRGRSVSAPMPGSWAETKPKSFEESYEQQSQRPNSRSGHSVAASASRPASSRRSAESFLPDYSFGVTANDIKAARSYRPSSAFKGVPLPESHAKRDAAELTAATSRRGPPSSLRLLLRRRRSRRRREWLRALLSELELEFLLFRGGETPSLSRREQSDKFSDLEKQLEVVEGELGVK